MRKNRTFTYITDSGHGWVKVPLKDIVNLGLVNDIGGYSYKRGDYVYLEEDCDYPKVLRELRARGVEVKYRLINCKTRPSRIRNYEHY